LNKQKKEDGYKGTRKCNYSTWKWKYYFWKSFTKKL